MQPLHETGMTAVTPFNFTVGLKGHYPVQNPAERTDMIKKKNCQLVYVPLIW